MNLGCTVLAVILLTHIRLLASSSALKWKAIYLQIHCACLPYRHALLDKHHYYHHHKYEYLNTERRRNGDVNQCNNAM